MRKRIQKISPSNDSHMGATIATSNLNNLKGSVPEGYFTVDKLDEERIYVILDLFAQGYEGDQVGLEIICRTFNKVLNTLPRHDLSYFYKTKFIGELVIRCLKHRQVNNKLGKISKIEALKILCCKLVIMAKEKGNHSIHREPALNKTSAFVVVSEIMNGYGIDEITASKVENWYNKYEEKYSTQKSK